MTAGERWPDEKVRRTVTQTSDSDGGANLDTVIAILRPS